MSDKKDENKKQIPPKKKAGLSQVEMLSAALSMLTVFALALSSVRIVEPQEITDERNLLENAVFKVEHANQLLQEKVALAETRQLGLTECPEIEDLGEKVQNLYQVVSDRMKTKGLDVAFKPQFARLQLASGAVSGRLDIIKGYCAAGFRANAAIVDYQFPLEGALYMGQAVREMMAGKSPDGP